MAGDQAAFAELPRCRRDGPGLVACAGAGAGAPRQARHRARRRRQPADESRELVTIAEAAPSNLYPFRLRERHLRGQRRPPDSRRRSHQLRRLRARRGLSQRPRVRRPDEFRAAIGAVLEEEGPVFVDLKVEPARSAGARLQPPARPACAPGVPRRPRQELSFCCSPMLAGMRPATHDAATSSHSPHALRKGDHP